MFSIDPRSLAAFRIGVAWLLLLDLAVRARDLVPFFTDEGVLPRTTRLEMLGYGDPLGFQHQWSLHLLNGQSWSQALLLGVAAWFAAWLLIGYRTRLAAFASWLLIVSLDHRNPLITDAGDSILRALLFWGLFLPLGLVWSVDAARHPPSPSQRRPMLSVPTAVILLQLAVMYWSSAIFKWHPVWIREFSAVYYAMHADTLATSWGIWLRGYPALMQILTAGTVVLELAGPLLVFSPWATSWCRAIAMTAFTLFHLGLAITLKLAFFPWVCLVGWLLFVPQPWWDALQQSSIAHHATAWWQARVTAFVRKYQERGRELPFARAEQPRVHLAWWKQAAVGLLFLYIAVWNVREILGADWVDRVMSHRFNGVAFALGLGQNWSMFAPVPRTDDGWLVMKGTLRDGSEVNLWEPGRPLPWDKPPSVSGMVPTTRWRSYLGNITLDRYAFHRQYLANWLQRRWDQRFAQGAPDQEVAKVEIIYQLEITPPPGHPIPPPEPVELCVRHY